MDDLVSRFPAYWRTDVTVIRGGGRDDRGNQTPVTEITVTGCAVGWSSSTEPEDRSELTESVANLYRDQDSEFRFLSTDRIRVPAGHPCDGTWFVDGRAREWPKGVHVPLKEG